MPTAWCDPRAFVKRLKDHRTAVIAAMQRGANAAGEDVKAKSQELCPEKTGHLKSTARVVLATFDGRDVKVNVVYDADYAAFVHEDLSKHHENGQAKFLETAVRVEGPKGNELVAGEVAQVK